jgi:hypothetical protein
MRLNIHDQFVVGVARPSGGWSKGRPFAYIEEDDKCVPLFDLLIPNDLDDEGVVRYVGEKFRAFAPSGKRATPLARAPQTREQTARQRGVAHQQAFAGVRR